MSLITGNKKTNCPHCGEDIGPIGDYVIPGRIGPTSISKSYSDCGNCDGIFSVEKVSEQQYNLTPVEGKYGDKP